MLDITAIKKKKADEGTDDEHSIGESLSYSRTTELAWYVLKEFISDLECNENHEGVPIPNNLKAVLQHCYSNTRFYGYLGKKRLKFYLKVFPFSKTSLHKHLSGKTTYYYRSKRKQPHQIGYGSTDKQAQEKTFLKELGIYSKRITYEGYYVILVGVDIDAHNDETDAEDVKNWIHTDYIRDSYWEKSTHGKGRHGYYKLAYPKWMKIENIEKILTEVHELLNQKRETLGFQCTVDQPCGFPTQFSFDPDVELTEINLHDISPAYQEQLSSLISGLVVEDYSYFIRLSDSDSEEITNLSKYPTKATLKTSQCFKIPRFNASHPSCNLEDILTFHSLPYYTIEYFIGIRDQLREELGLPKEQENDNTEDEATSVFPHSEENTGLLLDTSPLVGGAEEEGMYLPTVCTTFSGMYVPSEPLKAQEISWGEIPKQECMIYDYEYAKIKKQNKKQTFTEQLEEIRIIKNKVLRTNRFCWYLSVNQGYVPDLDTAIRQYIEYELNQNPDTNSKKRKKRFRATLTLINRLFDKDKLGLNLNDWKEKKEDLIDQITKYIKADNLKYDVTKNKQLKIKMEEIAFIYLVIYKSNLLDQDKTKNEEHQYSLSYDQIKKAMIEVYGSEKRKNGGYNRNKVCKILQLLQDKHLIIKTAHHIVGLRGNCYQIKKDLITKQERKSA